VASIRERIRMTEAETTAFLAAQPKLQLATINRDGTPHLVTMYFALVDEQIAFWTYATSQKARNLARDPRLTCLVEDGATYDELRGVQITGRVRTVSGTAAVQRIGEAVYRRSVGSLAPELGAYVADQARKRLGYLVEPSRVASWDHRKLAAVYADQAGGA
jgi:PPOX class probable F420-dependent enzyme